MVHFPYALVIACVLLIACGQRTPSAEGIYLANGGVDCLVLGKESGRLVVKQISITNHNFDLTKLDPIQTDDQLWIQYRETDRPGALEKIKAIWNREVWDDSDKVLLFKAAQTVGDWDLVKLDSKEIMRNLSDDNLPAGLPRYLHKLEDARIPQIFELIEKEQPAEALKIADAVLSDHPRDEFVKVMVLKVVSVSGDKNRFIRDSQKWLPELAASGNNRVQFTAALIAQQVYGLRKSDENRNAVSVTAQILDPATNFEKFIQLYPKYLDCDCWIDPMPSLKCSPMRDELAEIQTRARLASQWVTFMMLQGKFDEAARLAFSVYRQGSLFQQSFDAFDKMYGAAICSMPKTVLLDYSLNVLESESDFLQWRKRIEEMARLPEKFGPWVQDGTLPIEMVRKGHVDEEDMSRKLMNSLDYHARNTSLNLMLIRAATAARYHQLHSGQLPVEPKDFSFFPGCLANDPFTSNTSLRLIPGQDELIVYSVGPDRIDQKAAITYDPTNGTGVNRFDSPGDIVLKIPRERDHAYPRGGLHASTVADIQRQFPHGLPFDKYSTSHQSPLSVSPTRPIYIYSYGPDMDEPSLNGEEKPGLLDTDEDIANAEHMSMDGRDGYPEVMYDPTNGTYSSGDLWIQIPPPDKQ